MLSSSSGNQQSPSNNNEHDVGPVTPMFVCPTTTAHNNKPSPNMTGCKRLHCQKRISRRGISPTEDNTAESI